MRPIPRYDEGGNFDPDPSESPPSVGSFSSCPISSRPHRGHRGPAVALRRSGRPAGQEPVGGRSRRTQARRWLGPCQGGRTQRHARPSPSARAEEPDSPDRRPGNGDHRHLRRHGAQPRSPRENASLPASRRWRRRSEMAAWPTGRCSNCCRRSDRPGQRCGIRIWRHISRRFRCSPTTRLRDTTSFVDMPATPAQTHPRGMTFGSGASTTAATEALTSRGSPLR